MPLALLPQLIEPRKVPGEELEGNDAEGIDIPAFSTITREVTRGDLLGTGVKEQVTGLETLDPAHKNLSKIGNTEFLPALRISSQENTRRPQPPVEQTGFMNLGKLQGQIPHDLKSLLPREQGHEPLERADLPLLTLAAFPSVKREDTGGESISPLQHIIVDRGDARERRGAVAKGLEIRLEKASPNRANELIL